jgi:hypothetical protein
VWVVAQLVVLNGVAAGAVFSVGDVPAVVGRSPEAHLQIGDPWISGMHAIFERRGDAIWVVDLESRNGTFVGDVRVGEARVPDGEVVRLGRTEIRTSMTPAPGDDALPPEPHPPARRDSGYGEATISTRSPLVRERGEDPHTLAYRAATVLRMALDATAPDQVAAAPERIRAALDGAARAALDEGALVTRLAGIGVLALFGLGRPEPEDAGRALAAARAARRAVRAEGGLDLRAAVDGGAVLAGNAAGPGGFDLAALGPVAERAERLLALARSGEILAGPAAAGEGLSRVGLVRFGDLEIEVFRDERE